MICLHAEPWHIICTNDSLGTRALFSHRRLWLVLLLGLLLRVRVLFRLDARGL